MAKAYSNLINLVFNVAEDNTLDFTSLEGMSAYDYAVQYILKQGNEETKNSLFEITGNWLSKEDARVQTPGQALSPLAMSYNERRGFAVFKFLEGVLPEQRGPAGWLDALSSSSMTKLYEFSQNSADNLMVISHTMNDCRTITNCLKNEHLDLWLSNELKDEEFDVLLRLEQMIERINLLQKKIEQEKPKPGLLFKLEEDEKVLECFTSMEHELSQVKEELRESRSIAIESFKKKLSKMYDIEINFSAKTFTRASQLIELYGTEKDKLDINPLCHLLKKLSQTSVDEATISSVFAAYEEMIPSAYQQDALNILQKIRLFRELPADEENLKLKELFQKLLPDEPEMYQHFIAKNLGFINLTPENYVQSLEFMEANLTSQDPGLVQFGTEWRERADNYYKTTIQEALNRELLQQEDALKDNDAPSIEQLAVIVPWIKRAHPEDYSLILLQAGQYLNEYKDKDQDIRCLPLFLALDEVALQNSHSSLCTRYLKSFFLKTSNDELDEDLAFISKESSSLATVIDSVLQNLMHDRTYEGSDHINHYIEKHGSIEQKDELVLALLEGFSGEETFNQNKLDEVIALVSGRKEPILFYTNKGRELDQFLIKAADQLLT